MKGSLNKMQPTHTNISGLVLCAGASSRMGRHKALIEIDETSTLLCYQVELLRAAGCEDVIIVVGCDADIIIEAHKDLSVEWAINEEWELGQFSSIQAGLQVALTEAAVGAILLPIDAAGISDDTVRAIVEAALQNPHLDVIKPEYDDKGGHPIYLSEKFAEKLLKLDPRDDSSRLDLLIRKSTNVMRLPVNDENVLMNANRPDDLS